jgi:hypothetical protein
LESLKPEMRADSARQTKAKKAMLMEAADESVKTLSAPSRMRFVIGTAADSADIRRYAVTCKRIAEAGLRIPEIVCGIHFERKIIA